MKYGEMSKQVFLLAQKYDYGFSSDQLYEDSKKESLGLDKRQVLDCLYRHPHILYDKKRKVFISNKSGVYMNKVKSAEDLKKIQEHFLDSKVEEMVIKITDISLECAKKGENICEIPLEQILGQKERVFKRLVELGFQIEEGPDNKINIRW